MSTARAIQFPLPVASAVEQLYIFGSSQGYGKEDDAGLVRLFLPGQSNLVHEAAHGSSRREPLASSISPLAISKVGMIGLGAMGQGMAASLLRAGYAVSGYDVYEPSIDKFLSHGGKATGVSSPVDAVKGAEVVILMVQNASQVEDALFGTGNGIEFLEENAIVVVSSTVPPAFIRNLQARLDYYEKGLCLIDAPVSGGVLRAANGTLTVGNQLLSVIQMFNLHLTSTRLFAPGNSPSFRKPMTSSWH